MLVHVTMEEAEDGWIVIACPALPGCISQGKDEQEALANIKEAITGWLLAQDQEAVRSFPADQRYTLVCL
ncbi:MAG TPA: type II toxin-antitoxin system HicB family antitoxin [Acidobacteriaceae bacterium]